MNKLICIFILLATSYSTQSKGQDDKTSPYNNKIFSKYWDQGKAELNSYELSQSRYGISRQGEAVIIFVTEDFSKKKQVKLDYSNNSSDAVHSLKMNFTKKFITGLYPYSMMSSVFTPLDGTSPPMKLTTTSQEWCGQTFTQYNLRDNKYDIKLYSYFEKEGDKALSINDEVVLEDAIWNMIRINPSSLPIGKVKMMPGNLYLRLSHNDYRTIFANCTLKDIKNTDYPFLQEKTIKEYSIKYNSGKHTLTIYFQQSFPYSILGWKESYPDIMEKKIRTTSAKLKKQLLLDYWNKNKPKDSIYRDKLMIRY